MYSGFIFTWSFTFAPFRQEEGLKEGSSCLNDEGAHCGLNGCFGDAAPGQLAILAAHRDPQTPPATVQLKSIILQLVMHMDKGHNHSLNDFQFHLRTKRIMDQEVD